MPLDVHVLLRASVPVVIGVSGGNHSVACALVVASFLDDIGHGWPRVLIHAPTSEWSSGPTADRLERVAAQLGWPLHITRRPAAA